MCYIMCYLIYKTQTNCFMQFKFYFNKGGAFYNTLKKYILMSKKIYLTFFSIYATSSLFVEVSSLKVLLFEKNKNDNIFLI